jgi:heterodisulfide reductase subunit A-like polyferredoxin
LVGFGELGIAISSEEKSGAPQQMSTSPPKRIVILGGGFAGLYAAMELEKTLARDPEVEITLVNRENFFLELAWPLRETRRDS